MALFCALAVWETASPQGRPSGQGQEISPVLVEVSVREASGAPLPRPAMVRLYSFSGFYRTAPTQDASTASFQDITPGEYEIEVQASGYQKGTEHASVLGGGSRATFYVYLQSGNDSAGSSGPALTPVMTPKLQTVVQKALEKIKKQQYADALRDLEKAIKAAPGNPDIHYLIGMANSGLQRLDAARAEFEAALAIFPTHASSLMALGELQLRSGRPALAAETLEKGFQANGGNWRCHFLLATAYLQMKNYAKAESHIDRAVQLSKEKNAGVYVLRARILAAEDKVEESKLRLEEVISGFPNDPAVGAARAMLKELSKTESQPQGTAPDAPPVTAGSLLATPPIYESVQPWAPPDIDSHEYALASDVACRDKEVLARAQMRMKKQMGNFEKFTATEHIVHTDVGGNGIEQSSREKDFSYMVMLQHAQDGSTYLEENRDGGENLSQFPTSLAAKGLVSLGVALLDKKYEGDFIFHCDGLTKWRGTPVWQMRFEQKKDIPSRILIWENLRGSFPIPLRGRIWVGANTYELLHLESDLREPVATLELVRDHVAIDYGPVHFDRAETDLWLPWRADSYLEVHGKRYHHNHTLTNYLLFSVETVNKVSLPKAPVEEPKQN